MLPDNTEIISLDELVDSYHDAIVAERAQAVSLYATALKDRQARDPESARAIDAALAYPFDKGIPRYRSTRWYAVRDQAAGASRSSLPSDLNHDQRRKLGFRMPKVALERLGM